MTSFFGIFQSTHPLRGATAKSRKEKKLLRISIHAPLAGCDGKGKLRVPRGRDFNPRTPCGVRRGQNARIPHIREFQSTHPLRGATFSSVWQLRRIFRFQSTHPLRGATNVYGHLEREFAISIHAPLAGCDHGGDKYRIADTDFNPRTPCGVRRRFHVGEIARMNISIHAPLAGCDCLYACMPSQPRNFNPRTPCGVRPSTKPSWPITVAFQSTHPLRGAT